MLAQYPAARRWVYAVLGVTSLAIGATSAYLGAIGAEPPPWMLGVGAVWAFLAGATGYLAATNTRQPPVPHDQPVDSVTAVPDETDPRGYAVQPQRARDDDGDGIPDVKPEGR